MVIEHAPLEDELGDVLEKAMRHACLNEQALAERAQVPVEKICDAVDYRYDLDEAEIKRLAVALHLNEVGLSALARGCYPLPEVAGLPFCLYPLRCTYGIGVANAYVVADCALSSGVLFDTGPDYLQTVRVWPKAIRKIDAIFITHTETEHVGALARLRAELGHPPVFCPEGAVLDSATGLGDGARLSFGRVEVKALKTPGHSAAHNCYVVTVPQAPAAAPLLISGDMLFAGSTGAAFYCRQRFASSLRHMLDDLPDTTVVAAGHGPLTTIKNERLFNPFVL